MEDIKYNEIWNYLKYGKYPEGANKEKKRDIRKKSEPFLVQSDELYHTPKSGTENIPKKVVRIQDKQRLIQACHDDAVSGGHFGRDKTFYKISLKYYWKGMKNDISDYISKCDKCQRNSNKPPMQAPELHPVPVPNGAWKQVGMDLIGPLPKSKNGNQYICGLTDYFSKWPIAEAIPCKSAAEVAKVLIRAICTFGCFKTLITDQGREFVNQLNDIICDRLHIDHRIASAYHPQTNGLQERFNQTMERAIVKVANENNDDWDQHLDGILFAYRTSQHDSTKLSPFYVMFGRQPVLPVDMDLNAETNACAVDNAATVDTIKELTTEIVERQNLAHNNAQMNIEKAQKRQKQYYDAKHSCHINDLREGQLVLLKNNKNNHRMGGKLQDKWLGPYEITKCLSKSRVNLKNLQSGKELKNTYHSVNLKKYNCAGGNSANEEDPETTSNALSKEQKECLSCFVDQHTIDSAVLCSDKKLTEDVIECRPERIPEEILSMKNVLEGLKSYFDEEAWIQVQNVLKMKEEAIARLPSDISQR